MKHFGTFQEKRGVKLSGDGMPHGERGSNYLDMVCRHGERGVEYLEKFDDVIYGRPLCMHSTSLSERHTRTRGNRQ